MPSRLFVTGYRCCVSPDGLKDRTNASELFAAAIGPRAATLYHMKHSFNSNCAYFRQRRLETAPTPKIGTSAQMLPHQTGLENHSSRPVSAVPRIEIQQRYPVTMSLESPDTTSSLDCPEDVNEFTGKSAR